jgi:hypothetical protein
MKTQLLKGIVAALSLFCAISLNAAEYIEIYNVSGALVAKNKVENSSIDTNLNDGVYIVKLYKDNIIANTNKLIIK